ncbi:hypothetical protein SCP_0409490 [Sparassis crispa]|uniref:Uncharacterized protein n=1 Tax=Sparassis crispa TaxID=139825 RepID=A0A401GK77_9APHY|nr:hypothetical protein SCP_0409490 [Sparassis crispa]GBE82565.1 hypothetical protein SCP_0409490 [Sparassis crispa]
MASPISSSFPPSAVPYRSHFQHNPPLQFASLAQMLHHVTQNWRANFVTVDLNTRDALQTFVTRPFFMVVSVDGPLLTRFQRATR